MSSNKEKIVKGYLYGQVAQLKQHISHMYDNHRTELKTWTWKCGQMGNEIGRLRKQIAEKIDELSVKDTELRDVNVGLEQAQWENLKLKQRMEKKELDFQKLIDTTKDEVEALRRLVEQEKTEHQAEGTKVEVETDSKLSNNSVNNEIIDMTSDVAKITVGSGNLCEHSGEQINELEADSIVGTYCSSESETDGEKKVSEPVDTIELMVNDAKEDLVGNMTEQVQQDEDTKRKPKYHFWTTLKKRVSMKGKLVKPVPLTSKVSESD